MRQEGAGDMRAIAWILCLSVLAASAACQSTRPSTGTTAPAADSSGEPRPDGSADTSATRDAPSAADPDRKGCVQGECETGTGAFVYDNGDRYTGSFKGGLRDGNGIMEYTNGDRYEGSYVADQRNGRGTYTYKNGDVYAGEFKNGGREGSGSYRFAASGETYVGEFRDDGASGDGTFKRGEEQLRCALKGKAVLCEIGSASSGQ